MGADPDVRQRKRDYEVLRKPVGKSACDKPSAKVRFTSLLSMKPPNLNHFRVKKRKRHLNTDGTYFTFLSHLYVFLFSLCSLDRVCFLNKHELQDTVVKPSSTPPMEKSFGVP